MVDKVVRLFAPPKPTLAEPFAQVNWMFFQVEAEFEGPTAAYLRYARNKYLEYLKETNAHYSELKGNPRFYLKLHWEPDALVRFNDWLGAKNLASKSRYSLYKAVRKVMDMAYALRVIDKVVYHAPMFKGVSETRQRSAYSEEEQEVVNAAIAKWLGLAIQVLKEYEPTGQGIPYKPRNSLVSVQLNGKSYTPEEAAGVFGVTRNRISGRLRNGWTSREAVGLDTAPNGNDSSRAGTKVVVEGVEFSSINKAAHTYGVECTVVSLRLGQGYSPEQAVGIVPIHVHRSDEQALLWAFENEYACSAIAMLNDFRRRKLSQVCSEKRFRILFLRWGVWPFVDDRLVMPLAVELGMLTGLNVEALKALRVDSYQAQHHLTGQSVISYFKPRSGSLTRTEDRELHLPLLELEEVHLDGEVAAKVHSLVSLIHAITSKIRKAAPPEVQHLLFIFEDVELTRKLSKQFIVALDPKRKAGHWYRRFIKDEGLYERLGPTFSFNISRCRPTLATNMVLGGAQLFQVQAVLGHQGLGTTTAYLDGLALQPAFNKEMAHALSSIAARSISHQEQGLLQKNPLSELKFSKEVDFHETLSGCGCGNQFAPSENVRKLTNHNAGSPCKFWNMCLFCENAVVTEASLPKLIVYRNRVLTALDGDSLSIRPRRAMFKAVIELIDGILKEDVVFSKETIEIASARAATMDDLLVDQLIYQGV